MRSGEAAPLRLDPQFIKPTTNNWQMAAFRCAAIGSGFSGLAPAQLDKLPGISERGELAAAGGRASDRGADTAAVLGAVRLLSCACSIAALLAVQGDP